MLSSQGHSNVQVRTKNTSVRSSHINSYKRGDLEPSKNQRKQAECMSLGIEKSIAFDTGSIMRLALPWKHLLPVPRNN